jgi:hypothetical protein
MTDSSKQLLFIGDTTREITCNITLRRVYDTIVAIEKQEVLRISVFVCVCVDARGLVCACTRVALLIQLITPAILSSAASLALLYFLTLSHKRHDSSEKCY